MSRVGRAAVLAGAAGLVFALGCGRSGQYPSDLRVFAAASLTDVVGTLAAAWDGAEVVASFGASSALARQIRDGAPADVFLSASPEWVEVLRQAEMLDGAPVAFARNRLVAVAPRGSDLTARGPEELLAALPEGARVGIADEGVPAGEYARAALASLGVLQGYEPVLVGLTDVRAVVHAAELSGVAAGFVYATDAAAADVVLLFAFAGNTHPPIESVGAVVRGAGDPAAAHRFLAFLAGEAGRAALTAAGFERP